MTLFELYLVLCLFPSIASNTGTMCWLLVIAIAILGLMYIVNEDLDEKIRATVSSWIKRLSLIFSVFFFLTVVMPDEKQMLLIYGGYAATNSKEIAQLPDNVAKAANAYLGKIIKDTTETKK